MKVSYRRAEIEDAGACCQIIRDWRDETDWIPPIEDLEEMTQFWRKVLEHDLGWVAEMEGRIVGCCVRSDDNIYALYVVPETRNLGVGKALLDLAKENRDWITVWAFEKNEKARKFYRREGLVEINREMEVFDSGLSLMEVEHRWTRSS